MVQCAPALTLNSERKGGWAFISGVVEVLPGMRWVEHCPAGLEWNRFPCAVRAVSVCAKYQNQLKTGSAAPTTYPYSPTRGIKYEFEDNSGKEKMIDDFNKSVGEKAQQGADWLWAIAHVPTTCELLIYPIPPMEASWHFVPQGTIDCHGNY